MAYDQAGEQRKFQLQELDELRLEAYENSRIYKQKVKKFHDQKILRKDFSVCQRVLLFNSRLKLKASKLRSRWDGPFVITNIFPHGVEQLKDERTNNTFQVNGHQIKPFHEGIDFIGPFPVSYGNSCILLVIDYVSKWVEAKATKINDAKTVIEFVKYNIFYMFGVLKALISDQGSHFYNHAMATLLEKYEVVHKVTTAYHPQTNGQAEVIKLHDECHPTGLSSAKLVTYRSRLNTKRIGRSRTVGARGARLEAYEYSRIYKEKVKHFHDSRILRKEFIVGQKVLLFNSWLKLIVGKLRSRWDEPFVVTDIFPYGAVEVRDTTSNCTFKVNDHQLKPYHESLNLSSTLGEVDIITVVESVISDDLPEE
ncbi:putative protein K02A2.6, partial [Mucuna pruriens]